MSRDSAVDGSHSNRVKLTGAHLECRSLGVWRTESPSCCEEEQTPHQLKPQNSPRGLGVWVSPCHRHPVAMEYETVPVRQ